MKLQDLYTMDDDLLFCELDEDRDDRDDRDSEPLRKEKKDKSKKKPEQRNPDALRTELEGMKKHELREMALSMGIDPEKVDMTSKKAMRKAIMKKNGGDRAIADESISTILEAKGEKRVPLAKDAKMPYYLNEDTGDFVIPDALTCDGMVCYDAMQSLAYMREQKHPEDGFAEMVRRIGDRLAEEYKALRAQEQQPVIEAEFTVVDEAKALPPAETQEKKPEDQPKKGGGKYRK